MKKVKIIFCLFFLLTGSIISYADTKASTPAAATQNAPLSFGNGDSAQEKGEPYAELERMRRDLNRLLQAGLAQAGRGIDWAQTQGGVFSPRMDLVEEKDRYVMKADIPGMDKNKLDVQVVEKTLTIAGERSVEKEKTDKDTGIYQQERSFGRFQRTVSIPDNVQKDKISAKYDLGVLTIELPKIKPSLPEPTPGRKIPIQ